MISYNHPTSTIMASSIYMKHDELTLHPLMTGDTYTSDFYPVWTSKYLQSHPQLTVPSPMAGIGVEKSLSRVGEPLSFGMYAHVDIKPGTAIMNYGGLRRYASTRRLKDTTATHTINCSDGSGDILDGAPCRSALLSYTPHTQADLDAVAAMPIGTFGYEPTLLDSPIGPVLKSGLGYLCNTASHARDNNARYDWVRVRVPGGLEHNLRVVRARKHIKAGEQITCAYNTQQVLETEELQQ